MSGPFCWEEVVELASRHLVTPVLYRSLADKGLLADLPAEVRDYLHAIHCLNGERNRRIVDQTVEIAAALNEVGIEPVLLKGVAHLFAGLYPDPGARVIGDIDLLVASDQLTAALVALEMIGYREAGLDDFSFAAHHHHTPLARPDDVACVELHTLPVLPTFARLLLADRVICHARRVGVEGRAMRLPSPRDQVVHNIVHTQLADRHYWSGRVSLRHLSDLAWLRLAGDGAIDWAEMQSSFARAGHGGVCGAYLAVAERLFGLPLPAGIRPTAGARFVCRRVVAQASHPWLMAAGEWYGYHHAMIAGLWEGRAARRRVLARLLHPRGYRRYLNSLKAHIGRAG